MSTTIDHDVLIIGAGMSGVGLAIQLRRKYPSASFGLIEKTEDIGGTWHVNTYPGCGCDVGSHFYSYSFALNPDWSQKFSLQSEIETYFHKVADQYCISPHIRFGSAVESAHWDDNDRCWVVNIRNLSTKATYTLRSRALVSAVGSLSTPNPITIPGHESFSGPLFHSAQWDSTLDWTGKDIVVIGNGCSATQFVPVMAPTAKTITQFARQAHFLAERPNPTYSPTFKSVMRYVPFVMRLYRFQLYADMEKDFAGFDVSSGASIRAGLKKENEAYVKRMAPERYWDALIPKYEIGCKRKVMDTDYLSTLHRANVELIHADPIASINTEGVTTASGREVHADAIVLATGFQAHRLLAPMKITGRERKDLNEHWEEKHGGSAQAYFGTLVPGFPNFGMLMGPNTVTGHLSVIYTVECQINFLLRLLAPILSDQKGAKTVEVKPEAAAKDSSWLQSRLGKLVWSSGCTSWALDPDTGVNVAMYPEYQWHFWLRSIFIPANDFVYEGVAKGGRKWKRSLPVGGWKTVRRVLSTSLVLGLGALGVQRAGGWRDVRDVLLRECREVLRQMNGVVGIR